MHRISRSASARPCPQSITEQHLVPHAASRSDAVERDCGFQASVSRDHSPAQYRASGYTASPPKGACVMPRKEILAQIQKYVHPFRIAKGKDFQLKHFDPGDTRGLKLDKGEAAELLQRGTQWLVEEQDMLYAQDRWSLLLGFQALDPPGQGGTTQQRGTGGNPQERPGRAVDVARG